MNGGRKITGAVTLAVTLLAILLMSTMPGCKKSPLEPVEPIAATAAGSYVGFGNLGQGEINIWMSVIADAIQSDTTGIPSLSGYIKYAGVQDQMLSVTTNASEDTLAIEFARNSVVYRAISPITSIGME